MKTVSLKFAGCAALLALGLNAGAAIGTQEDFNNAVASASAGDVIELESNGGSYKIPAISQNITIQSAAGVKFDCTGSGQIASIPNGATFKGGEFSFGQSGYHGFQHPGHIKMEGCTLNGLFFSYGDMTFTGCHFVQTAKDYNMWTYAGNVSYIDCDFTFKGKCINVYRESSDAYDISFSGCTFNSDTKNKAAVNVKATCVNGAILSYTVKLTKCQINDPSMFPAPAPLSNGLLVIDGLVQVDDIDEAHQPDNTTVFLNDAPAYPVPVAKEIEIEPVTKDESKGITEEIAAEINNNTEVKKIVESGVNDALANIDPEGEAVVKVELKKVEKAAETPTLTFEVAPFVGGTMVANVNEKLNGKKVTVVLPLTKDFTISAIVTHEGDPDRLLPVLGLPNSPYVRLETTHFSEFIATPNSQKVSSTEVDAKTVLGIKRVTTMTKSVDTAAAVPWIGAAGGNCTVAELITTGLAEDDQIMVYDKDAKKYYTWYFTSEKTWEPMFGSGAPAATEYRIERGRAFWYKKDIENESLEYTQIGTYSADQIQTVPDKGAAAAPVHNLLINPKWADFNVSQSLVDGAIDGDQIVIVDTKVRYEFKVVEGVGKWGTIQPTTKTVKIGGVERTVRGPDEFVPVETDLIILAGKAFWYISKGGVPTVKW